MTLLPKFLWFGLITISLLIGFQEIRINYIEKAPFNILQLEFAGKEEGRVLLEQWASASSVPPGYPTLLREARRNTHEDYIFIFFYTSILILISYNQMQREGGSRLNSLLRLNLFLAPLAGLLDVTENIILLQDMRPYNIGAYFLPSHWVSLFKFFLIIWILLIWILSILAAKASRNPGM